MKEALEKERARQIALVAMAQEQSNEPQEYADKPTNSDALKSEMARSILKQDKISKRPSKDPTSINKNNSGVSLDYSVDSTSYIGGDGSTFGGSSLLGGRFAGDASIGTTSTKGTWSNSVQRKDPLALSANEAYPTTRDDDDEVSGFSLQESTSTMEVVPTDEELFAVGWAKALDRQSGSYYYFTLDRTKIVWDNPLASRGASVDSGETGSLPEGAAVI